MLLIDILSYSSMHIFYFIFFNLIIFLSKCNNWIFQWNERLLFGDIYAGFLQSLSPLKPASFLQLNAGQSYRTKSLPYLQI